MAGHGEGAAAPAGAGHDVAHVLRGDPQSPVVLHVPHAARHIPPRVRAHLELDEEGVEAELDRMTDVHTDLIARQAADLARVRPWVLVNANSRLVVDPERFPDGREEMTAVGMGAVYTRTATGERLRRDDPDHAAWLMREFYAPYAAEINGLVQSRLEVCGRVCVLDVHSYPPRALPYELHPDGHRPEVCLGTDPFHTPADLLEGATRAFTELGTATNTPFSGCYVPWPHYQHSPAVTALMLELRRDLYLLAGNRPHPVKVAALAGRLAMVVDRAR